MTAVIVVGAGIVGRCCALALQTRGCTVTLIGEEDATPASWGNAGHIATEQIAPLADLGTLRRLPHDLFPRGPIAIDWVHLRNWLPWSLRFLNACRPSTNRAGRATLQALLADALPAWQRLTSQIGEPALLDERGIVKLLARADAPRRAAIMTEEHWGTARAERLDEEAVNAINALLTTPVRAAVRFPGTAHIRDPRQVFDRIDTCFMTTGGTRLNASVTTVRPLPDGITVASTCGTFTADKVVIAGGVRSPELVPGLSLPMIAERGYHLEWDHGGAWTGPNVVFEDRALVVTRFGDRLRATSFVEFTRHDTPPDPRKWRMIERHIRELGLPVQSAFTPWHGSRPTLPDYLPAIGSLADFGSRGVYLACGHNHLGLTLAPTTAERLTAHMLDGAPLPPALRADRFTTVLRRTRS